MTDNSFDIGVCARCGSKRRVLKTWQEEMPTMLGKPIVITHSQVICTNDACQAVFDENIVKETKKREDILEKKEAQKAERKAQGLINATKHKATLLKKTT